MYAQEVIRRAAAAYFRSAPTASPCTGRYVCAHCPDDRYHPPLKPFRLRIHMREHLATNPRHQIVWWCNDHLAYDCTRSTPLKAKRGGSRPGAGAPKHNRNRLTHGRYSKDAEAREAGHILSSLPPNARNKLRPLVKAGLNSIKRRLSWIDTSARLPENVTPFPSSTTTTQPVQSNPHLDELTYRMVALSFFGATLFLQQHDAAYSVIEQAVTHVEQMDDAHNPAGLIRHLVHQELAEVDGTITRCPYCPWTDAGREERTS